jgi:DNA-binding NarL/FixJ family response regulator
MRVVIAEDQALLREGLARLFADGGHDVLATLSDAVRLEEVIAQQPTDLVVIDIRMPPTYTDEGIRAARDIKARYPAIGVLVLSQHIETMHALDLVTQEGFGYLLKDRVLEVGEFLATAQRVAGGGSALDPKVVAGLVAAGAQGPLARLSERERLVLELMAEGLTNTGIAHRLVVSERTIEAHVRHILLKLDIPESEEGHRRVLAVLAHLRAVHGWH